VVRVASWNVAFRGPASAASQGQLLRELGVDLVLLQEVNPGSAEVLRQAAGADWLVCAIDHRVPGPDDRPVRWRGVAIAGSGSSPRRVWLPMAVALPDRILLAEVFAGGLEPDRSFLPCPAGRELGPGQATPGRRVRILAGRSRRAGGARSPCEHPLIDAPEFADTKTHWHTGGRNLHGEPGGDLLFGPGTPGGAADSAARTHPTQKIT
jgi:hypothetical protein